MQSLTFSSNPGNLTFPTLRLQSQKPLHQRRVRRVSLPSYNSPSERRHVVLPRPHGNYPPCGREKSRNHGSRHSANTTVPLPTATRPNRRGVRPLALHLLNSSALRNVHGTILETLLPR